MFNEQKPRVFNPFTEVIEEGAVSDSMMLFIARTLAGAKGIQAGKLNFLDKKYSSPAYSLREKLQHAIPVPDVALPAHYVSAVFLERFTPTLLMLLPQDKDKKVYQRYPEKYKGNFMVLLFLHWLIVTGKQIGRASCRERV